MRPQDSDSAQPQPTVSVPTRQDYSLVSSRGDHPGAARAHGEKHQEATANIARQQLGAIYANDPNSLMDVEAEPATITDHPQTRPQHAYKPSDDELAAALEQVQTEPQATSPTTPAQPEPTQSQPQPDPEPELPAPAAMNEPRRFSERTIQPASQPETTEPTPSQQPELTIDNPYERTHDDSQLHANSSQWQQYHSAWQQYYQQYFHQYYAAHIQSMSDKLEAAHQQQPAEPSEITPEQAMDDIRSRIRTNVRNRATKVRKSRHFVPVAAAIAVMLIVSLLQYNKVLFSNLQAYVMPGNVSPPSLIVETDPTAVVGPDPLLVIPKINVEVPVVWDAKPDQDSQMEAMKNGVAWFGIPGANSKPGQIGNTPIAGHSSNEFFDNGNYKFVFAPLHRLGEGDTIDIHYQGTLYTYVVTKKEVVAPTDVGALIYETDKPMLTLITCTPLGTALNRLLVTAEQVSPSPSQADEAPDAAESEAVQMPGTQPSVFERMFGAD